MLKCVFLGFCVFMIVGARCSGNEVKMAQVAQNNVFEGMLQSNCDYANPFVDVTIKVRFTAPSRKSSVVEAFWDGGRTWRVRFSPDRIGEWRWESECSDPENAGLHGRKGQFRCTAYKGSNPFYQRGPIGLSKDGHYFAHRDETPFLWLGDTAWAGVIEAEPKEWERYLVARRSQGFNVIQVCATHWHGITPEISDRSPYSIKDGVQLNPGYFQRVDRNMSAINRHGLVAASVLLWSGGKNHPSQSLSNDDLIRLARYMVARWGAYHIVWLLGGDGDFHGERSEKWKVIGRGIFGDRHDRLVTMHQCGLSWLKDEFRGETWYDFIGYQSGHGDAKSHLQWFVTGPPSQQWRKSPTRPLVNLEPNYENGVSYHTRTRFEPQRVRRANYWSLLVTPPAGVTYGWWVEADRARKDGIPEWSVALNAEGAASIKHLRTFFGMLPWWRLRPAQELLATQPGVEDPTRFVVAAKTDDGAVAVVYMPRGCKIILRTESLKQPAVARWFDPRNGKWRQAAKITSPTAGFTTPDDQDWVLCIRSDRKAWQ